MNVYHKAEKPTFYFIGVTTEQSSIMRVFPKWAELLGLDGLRVSIFSRTPLRNNIEKQLSF